LVGSARRIDAEFSLAELVKTAESWIAKTVDEYNAVTRWGLQHVL